jgi:hypothetical protein
MSTKNKKKPIPTIGPMSDKKYVQSGSARKLPIHQCLVNRDWREAGLAQVIVCRKHVTGNITGAFYLVDLFCVGVKESIYFFNESSDMLSEMQAQFEAEQGIVMETCVYRLAHNIIYRALDFARKYGIEPSQDFDTTKMILEPDDEGRIKLIDINCGKEGKPFLIVAPSDPRRSYYLRQLQQYAGEGSSEFLFDKADFDKQEDEDEDDEDDEDDFSFGGLEWWFREDWEDFFLNGSVPEGESDEGINIYIYQKVFYGPELTARKLDIDQLIARLTRGITYDPIKNRDYGNDPEENRVTLEIHSIISRGDSKAKKLRNLIPSIQESIKRWPGNPILHNYLCIVYIRLQEGAKAENLLLGITERFPDYLFGKTTYAQKLLEKGRADKIPALFGGHFDLSSLYPKRDSFHISEFLMFTATLCLYYLEIGDELMACIYGTLLREFATESTSEFTSQVLTLLDMKLKMKVLNKLVEANQDKVKREELIELLMSS